MKNFEYADGEIGYREIMFAVPSIIIGVGILSLPRQLSLVTKGSDGWVSIILGGIIVGICCWIVSKLASRFPGQTFYDYSAKIITKPVALILTVIFAIHFSLFTAYEMRSIAFITKQYLLHRTPTEVIALAFLLVVIYSVAGERVSLFRLNIMFLPIIFFITLIVGLFNIQLIEMDNFFPVFQTSISGYASGVKETIFSFEGFEILLFYVALMNRPKKAMKASLFGMSVVVILYLFIHIITIGSFSYLATAQLLYPTVELAKEVQVPGGFFERFESIFFTIWIMALFNTAAMGYDVALLAINSIFKRVKKHVIIFIMAPIIYIVGLLPQDFNGMNKMAQYISYLGVVMGFVLPAILLVLAKLRRLKGNAKV